MALKACTFYSPGRISLEEFPEPTPGYGEVLVRVEVTLTCGTDLKMFKRGHPLARPPIIMGHEFAGRVVEVGRGVEGLSLGDKIVAANSAPCLDCFWCLRGQENLCERLAEVLLGFTVPGTFSTHILLPKRLVRVNTHKLPPRIEPKRGAFLEPLACVVHGQQLLRIEEGEKVLVIGPGPIGLLHLQLAKARGAEVAVLGRSDARLGLAKRLGAHDTFKIADGFEEEIKRWSDGRGPDVVIEATGKPKVWEASIKLVRKGGRVLLFGGCPQGSAIPLDTYRLHYEELTLMGSFHHNPKAVRMALELIAAEKVVLDPLLTHSMSLERVREALELMEKGEALKVALLP